MKKAMQLSLNFLVMLILSIIVFGIGIRIVTEILPFDPEPIYPIIDEELIKKNLQQRSVALGINKKDITRDEHDQFYIGIKNTHETAKSFSLDVDCVQAVDLADHVLCSDEECDINWWMNKGSCYQISRGDSDIKSIFMKVPKDAESGIYAFRLEVLAFNDKACTESIGTDFDSPKKFYVTVKG